MSLNDCITRSGLSDEDAALVRAEAENLRLAGEAEDKAAAFIAGEKRRQRQNIMRQARMNLENANFILSHPNGPNDGLRALLARDTKMVGGSSNIDQRHEAILRIAMSKMAEAADKLRIRADNWFTTDKELMHRVVRGLFDEATDTEATRLARQIKASQDWLVDQFNLAGGRIAKRKDFGLPQNHDRTKVMSVSQEEWKSFITDNGLLSRERMRDYRGMPLTEEGFEELLDYVYQSIVTRGTSKTTFEPGGIAGKIMANQRQESRYLVFKNADAWMQYNDRFGTGNPWFTLTNHMKEMAADIAMMEILGPNPTAAYRQLRDIVIQKQGGKTDGLGFTDAIWATVSGKLADNPTMSPKVGAYLDEARNFITASRLGSAMISAASDVSFFRQTTAWNDLNTARAFRSFFQLMNPANAEHRRMAVQFGLISESWLSMGLAANRFSEVIGQGAGARTADFMMRISGLNHWTDVGHKAIQLEWLMRAAELSNRGFGELSEGFRRSLDMVGFTEADWNVIRNARRERWAGSQEEILDLTQLAASSNPAERRAAMKAMEVQETLARFALPMPDANARAAGQYIGGDRGTIMRELMAKGALQFMSFPISVILSHVYRGLYVGAASDKLQYAASLAIATTMMGAAAVQMKELSQGRTPRDMKDHRFWTAAFLQGGGAGIYGDFLYSAVYGVNRFGNTMAETLAGPQWGLATDVLRMTTGQFGRALTGEDVTVGAQAVEFAGKYTPVLSSLWYARVAYERAVINQLQLMADPVGTRRRFRADESRRAEQTGNEYWWRRGELTPEFTF